MQALTRELEGKLCTAKYDRFWYIYLIVYGLRYVPESTLKILWTQLRLGDFKKTCQGCARFGNGRHGEENVCRFEDYGNKLGNTRNMRG